jgi:hypothetical protein
MILWARLEGGLFEVYEYLAAVIFALAAIVIDSKAAPDQASRAMFERMQ